MSYNDIHNVRMSSKDQMLTLYTASGGKVVTAVLNRN